MLYLLPPNETESQPQSGRRLTAPTPSDARRWVTLANANLRGLTELVMIHARLTRQIEALKGDDPVEPEYLEATQRQQLIALSEALSEAKELCCELEAFAAAD